MYMCHSFLYHSSVMDIWGCYHVTNLLSWCWVVGPEITCIFQFWFLDCMPRSRIAESWSVLFCDFWDLTVLCTGNCTGGITTEYEKVSPLSTPHPAFIACGFWILYSDCVSNASCGTITAIYVKCSGIFMCFVNIISSLEVSIEFCLLRLNHLFFWSWTFEIYIFYEINLFYQFAHCTIVYTFETSPHTCITILLLLRKLYFN